jgi:sugar lactone lactonase YvrE
MAVVGLLAAAPLRLPAQDAEPQMQYPLDVAVADDGTVYLADRSLPGVWVVKDGVRSLYFQGPKKFRQPLNAIRCLAVDQQGRLLAGDSATRNVYRFDKNAQPQPLVQDDTGIGIPMALAVGQDGEIFVADLELRQIVKLPADGGQTTKVADVPAPRGLDIDQQGRLWVVCHGDNQVLRIEADGSVQVVVQGRPFRFPHHLALGPQGEACVADGFGQAIWKFPVSGEGEPEKWVGEPLVNPVGLAWDGQRLLVADPRANALLEVDAEGKVGVVSRGP